MKQTIFEYYKASLIAFVAFVLVSPMAILFAAYGSVLWRIVKATWLFFA